MAKPERICLLLPTRGRPHNMEIFWESAHDTAEDPNNLSVWFYVDDDDEPSINKLVEMIESYGEDRVNGIVGPRIVMSDMTNELYENTVAEIYMFCGDDILFRTPNWDTKVREKFLEIPDRIGLVGGHDGYNKDIITHGFLHHNWIKTVGFVVPPGYVGDYADTYVNDIATKLNRSFRIDILTEHMHWSCGKGTIDKTMQEKNARTYSGDVPAQVQFSMDSAKRLKEVARLKAFIDTFEKKEKYVGT